MANTQKEIIFDPKDFINPPYWNCPKCQAHGSFGVLSIGVLSYRRRCKSCLFSETYSLPQLNKKVIYLDQMAVSEMMKALNSGNKANKEGKVDPYWKILFEKLETLSKLQLIVCPDSEFHNRESTLSGFKEDLEKMYKLLSGGIHFRMKNQITESQLFFHFEQWLSGNDNPDFHFNAADVVDGEYNKWDEKIFITVTLPIQDEHVKLLRDSRDETSQQLWALADYWKSQGERKLNDFYETEWSSFGKTHLERYYQNYRRLQEIENLPEAKGSFEDYLPNESVTLINKLILILKLKGWDETRATQKVIEYLNSPSLKNIPFLKISSFLYATLARKFSSGGRNKPPGQGTITDFNIISTYIPYCDAMFIDNECHSYLQENPLKVEVQNMAKTFSKNNREEFLVYLDQIKSEIPVEHYEKVKEVYGEGWEHPYFEIFEKN
ncbi:MULTISPECIES: hypothetical protein [unclassified Leptospira]|uniref:hypothetical protein n=1 Tax=unclassified Leptospira TaxID=2633828 RepID=UPI0002BFACA1|nr:MULTISPECIES: hypothetical protein [unclassified Leptospira]EMK01234.1 hypothetical protein LEP1GSC192_1157 [Leptospira sp. B5-022]MCR1795807.1 hypothetical protein [Leptospira sp. id769339]